MAEERVCNVGCSVCGGPIFFVLFRMKAALNVPTEFFKLLMADDINKMLLTLRTHALLFLYSCVLRDSFDPIKSFYLNDVANQII
jgi:hypothetical protein